MMNISVVLRAAAATINWGERASTAGTVTLMGMVTIFSVLAILCTRCKDVDYGCKQ